LREAEPEADVIVWDGGNNDVSFIKPGLSITVADALRPGHEVQYYPGETNLRMADVVVINKVENARSADIQLIHNNIHRLNPRADVVESDLDIFVDDSSLITDRTSLVVEDGPTITHGGMPTGAGFLAARRYHAARIIDPRKFAVGSIAESFSAFPHIGSVLPALGYSEIQVQELNETINACGAEVIIDASPAGLAHVIRTETPIARVRYEFRQRSGQPLNEIVEQFLSE
ncbi:MAG: GTPase, partial [Planctomycetaceae bacterium]|nr:GTPase [Planctomycetaceae bacterium]